MRTSSLLLPITTIALCIVSSISFHISRNREFGAFTNIFRNNNKMPSHSHPDPNLHYPIPSTAAAAASTDTCTDMASVIGTSPVKTKRTFIREIFRSLYHSLTKEESEPSGVLNRWSSHYLYHSRKRLDSFQSRT